MKKIKNDIILIGILCVIALSIYIIVNLCVYKQGTIVKIYFDSNLIKTVRLEEDMEYEIKENNHINIIKIKNGKVFMKEADCPDKLCEKQGAISRNGESIICLPNKIVIKIISNEKSDVDANSR